MPVRVTISDKPASPRANSTIPSPEDLLNESWLIPRRCKRLFQSSFYGRESTTDFSKIHAVWGGFVGAVTTAYGGHHHLIIRPDDVWMAMLAQFNVYKTQYVQTLEGSFTPDPRDPLSNELYIEVHGTLYDVNYKTFAAQITAQIDEHLTDKGLKSWILPNFSTTTYSDRIICGLFVMSQFKDKENPFRTIVPGWDEQAYYIPSVTLEGVKADWEKLLSRLDRLDSEFGPEPRAWAGLLRPILTRFVNAFDGQSDVEFWNSACSFVRGKILGRARLCGWITAFCVWKPNGEWQGPPLNGPQPKVFWNHDIMKLVMDRVKYGTVYAGEVLQGFCDVRRKIVVDLGDNWTARKCTLVYGLLGTVTEGENDDAVRPLPAWYTIDSQIRIEPVRQLLANTGLAPLPTDNPERM